MKQIKYANNNFFTFYLILLFAYSLGRLNFVCSKLPRMRFVTYEFSE